MTLPSISAQVGWCSGAELAIQYFFLSSSFNVQPYLIYCIISIPCSEYLIIYFLMGFSVALITTVSDVSQILMNIPSNPVRKANDTFLNLQLEKGEQRQWELPATTERSWEQRSLQLQVLRLPKPALTLPDYIILLAEVPRTHRLQLPHSQQPVLSTHVGQALMSVAHPGNTLPS